MVTPKILGLAAPRTHRLGQPMPPALAEAADQAVALAFDWRLAQQTFGRQQEPFAGAKRPAQLSEEHR